MGQGGNELHSCLSANACVVQSTKIHISGVNRANQWAIRLMRRAHPLRKRGNFQQIRRILMKSDGASANYNARREAVILRILSAHLLGCFCKKEKKKKDSKNTARHEVALISRDSCPATHPPVPMEITRFPLDEGSQSMLNWGPSNRRERSSLSSCSWHPCPEPNASCDCY